MYNYFIINLAGGRRWLNFKRRDMSNGGGGRGGGGGGGGGGQ